MGQWAAVDLEMVKHTQFGGMQLGSVTMELKDEKAGLRNMSAEEPFLGTITNSKWRTVHAASCSS